MKTSIISQMFSRNTILKKLGEEELLHLYHRSIFTIPSNIIVEISYKKLKPKFIVEKNWLVALVLFFFQRHGKTFKTEPFKLNLFIEKW